MHPSESSTNATVAVLIEADAADEVIDKALARGASPNTCGRNGAPLYLAAKRNRLAVVASLLRHGADIEESGLRDGTTPLYVAAWLGHAAVVAYLLDAGANVQPVCTVDGRTPLHVCALLGLEDVARLLIEHGAPIDMPDRVGQSPLHTCCAQGRVSMAALLLRHGGRWDIPNGEGKSALELARDHGHTALEELIQQTYGALLIAVMNVCGLSSLQVLYESLQVKFPDGEALADVHGLRDDIELFPYQRETVLRMLDRETDITLYADPLRDDEDECAMYMDTPGGILCEEMGFGKTMVCIALILVTRGSEATPPPLAPLQWESLEGPCRKCSSIAPPQRRFLIPDNGISYTSDVCTAKYRYRKVASDSAPYPGQSGSGIEATGGSGGTMLDADRCNPTEQSKWMSGGGMRGCGVEEEGQVRDRGKAERIRYGAEEGKREAVYDKKKPNGVEESTKSIVRSARMDEKDSFEAAQRRALRKVKKEQRRRKAEKKSEKLKRKGKRIHKNKREGSTTLQGNGERENSKKKDAGMSVETAKKVRKVRGDVNSPREHRKRVKAEEREAKKAERQAKREVRERLLERKRQLEAEMERDIKSDFTPHSKCDCHVRSLKELSLIALKRCGGHRDAFLPFGIDEMVRAVPPRWYWDHERSNRPHCQRSARVQVRQPVYLSAGTLIVVPVTLLDQWVGEFQRVVEPGALRILVVDSALVPHPRELCLYDVIIIPRTRVSGDTSAVGHGLWKGGFESFLQVHWLRVIVDESHVLGTASTRQSILLNQVPSSRRWCCSGTPTAGSKLEYELAAIGNLLRFARQEPFTSTPRSWHQLVRSMKEGSEDAGHQLKAILTRVMVRHRRENVLQQISIPDCSHEHVRLTLSEREAWRYNEIVLQIKLNLLTSQEEGVDSLAHVRNRRYARLALSNVQTACFFTPGLYFSELDKCLRSIHHTMATGIFKTAWERQEAKRLTQQVHHLMLVHRPPDARDASSSSKLRYLMHRLQQEVYHGRKCIVFSQYDTVLAHIIEVLEQMNTMNTRCEGGFSLGMGLEGGGTSAESKQEHVPLKFLEFHSKIGLKERSRIIVQFNSSPDVHILVMKTQLAAFGINLPSASRIFFVDPVFSKEVEAQAIRRAHRLGQRNKVCVETLYIENSIEDHLLRMRESTRDWKDNGKSVLSLLRSLQFLIGTVPTNSLSLLPALPCSRKTIKAPPLAVPNASAKGRSRATKSNEAERSATSRVDSFREQLYDEVDRMVPTCTMEWEVDIVGDTSRAVPYQPLHMPFTSTASVHALVSHPHPITLSPEEVFYEPVPSKRAGATLSSPSKRLRIT